MNRLSLFVVFAAFSAACSTSFAQRQQAVGPGLIPLDANGVANGVDMVGSLGTGTLIVGALGGPRTDIFSQNLSNFSLQAVSSDASSTSNIRFNSGSRVFGAIGLSQGPFFLNLFGGNAGTSIDFLGGVFATQVHVTGTGAVNFNSGTVNRTAAIFDADGTISLAANTTLIGALTTTAGANTGTLVLANGSVLDGAVGAGSAAIRSIDVVGGSDIAGSTARITGAVNSFAFSLGTNTLLIDGALTIAQSGAAGVINTTLASPTVFGNIRPVGATNLGPTLQLNLTVPATSFIPVGTVFNIVQTQTGTPQSGTNGSVLNIIAQNPTNPLYRFSGVPPAGTVNGQVAIRVDAIPLQVPIAPPPGVVLPPAAAIIAPVLLNANPSPDLLLNVLPAINALSDANAVINAVAQLAPRSSDLSAPLVAFHGSRQVQSLWLSHMDDLTSAGSTGRTTETTGWRSGRHDDELQRVWVKGSGYFGDQDDRGVFPGYDSRILSTMVGYDRHVGTRTRVGGGIGYARADVNGRGLDQGSSTDFDTYQGTLYAMHERGRLFTYGDLSYASNDYTGRRRISFPGLERVASSRYRGDSFGAFAAAGYRLVTGGLTVTPLASLQYTPLDVDGYTETGAGDISLNVQAQKADFLESGLGVKVSRLVRHRDEVYLPEVHAKWLHLLDNPTLQKTAAFNFAGSPSFVTPGLTPADDTYNVGAGITFLQTSALSRAWTLQGVYDHDWRSDGFSADQGTVKVATRF